MKGDLTMVVGPHHSRLDRTVEGIMQSTLNGQRGEYKIVGASCVTEIKITVKCY